MASCSSGFRARIARWKGLFPCTRNCNASSAGRGRLRRHKRVFDLVKDFGTSESPKSTRSSTTHWCPGRPGHPAFRHNIASSLRLHTGLPYDWTPRSDAPLGSPLAPSARRVSRVASRLPGTTRLRFALHGGQRASSSRRWPQGLLQALSTGRRWTSHHSSRAAGSTSSQVPPRMSKPRPAAAAGLRSTVPGAVAAEAPAAPATTR